MMNRRRTILKVRQTAWMGLLLLVLNSCGGEVDPNAPTDTLTEGTIHISADESFKPVIDSQVQVFEASNPAAKIVVHYKPEAECLKDFAVDSIRMVIATRSFTPAEERFMTDSLKVDPSFMRVAFDAVAAVVHPQSSDTLLKLADIRDLLAGNSSKKLQPVFDGTRATSTVRFALDSILKGAPLGPNITAAQSSAGVIDYVAKTKNAIGFIGVCWIGNPEDSTQLSYLDKVRVVQLESPHEPGIYVTPAQYNIAYGRYPMIRSLYYVLKERHNGLGHGFGYFLTGQRGQLVFKRAYLMPGQMAFNVRQTNLRDE
ncbi:substrate-binding domain-containing protein [Paraflavisolibacter sp. H34]|uniref:PstS family phosphate ABC transporter substrate-binding protein n=1 Tax=Huijunlia imazamoxiresistens TaxID=3127457 RepID=UPI003016B98E